MEGGDDPSRDERIAGVAAMASFVVCGGVGQVLVLWWARRHRSLFARRTAWASLAPASACMLGLDR